MNTWNRLNTETVVTCLLNIQNILSPSEKFDRLAKIIAENRHIYKINVHVHSAKAKPLLCHNK